MFQVFICGLVDSRAKDVDAIDDGFNAAHPARSIFSGASNRVARGVSSESDYVIRNRNTGEVIAEQLAYSAWRGWIDALIASVIDNSAGVCYKRPGMYEKFPEILIPTGGKK